MSSWPLPASNFLSSKNKQVQFSQTETKENQRAAAAAVKMHAHSSSFHPQRRFNKVKLEIIRTSMNLSEGRGGSSQGRCCPCWIPIIRRLRTRDLALGGDLGLIPWSIWDASLVHLSDSYSIRKIFPWLATTLIHLVGPLVYCAYLYINKWPPPPPSPH